MFSLSNATTSRSGLDIWTKSPLAASSLRGSGFAKAGQSSEIVKGTASFGLFSRATRDLITEKSASLQSMR